MHRNFFQIQDYLVRNDQIYVHLDIIEFLNGSHQEQIPGFSEEFFHPHEFIDSQEVCEEDQGFLA